MTRFITKGTISALASIISFSLATAGHKQLAALLNSPEFIQNVLALIGAATALYAGIAQGITPKAVPAPIAPATPEDPYPGWDYDPLRGWVKSDGK